MKNRCMMCDVLVGQVANREKEIADLKQQLHAYREYHKAKDECEKLARENAPDSEVFPADDRMHKANEALQILRNK